MFKLQIAGTPVAVQKWTTDNAYKTEATAKRRARQIMKADAGVYSVWIREAAGETESDWSQGVKFYGSEANLVSALAETRHEAYALAVVFR